ncbi:MFS transporter [Schlesneria paludicola]|uniref:MFS transporter n=1 Tax=Schlesneria paludicola TaxID=360056 RepID=UPI00029A8E4B|nr:MFS transporter [Schlesneria paludicola]
MHDMNDDPTSDSNSAPVSAYAPLQRPVFRALWIASVASNLGTWLQNVGAAWLMTSLSPSPMMVAFVQAATTLPVFILAIPAGALADVVDRKRLLLIAQAWMLLAATILSAATFFNVMTPWLLLALTFALGVGFALNAPAWQAIIPELVPRSEVPAAVALNGVSMNASRAVGPAIGGLLVAAAGPAAAFLLNAISFVGVFAVLFSWRRSTKDSALPSERLVGALRVGIRYVRNAPQFQAILVRAAAFVTGASGLWALLPLLARTHADWGPLGYGVMLGAVGAGAVIGTILLPSVRNRVNADLIALGGSLVYAAGAALLTIAPGVWTSCLVLLPCGAAWLAVLTEFSSSAQSLLPAWVRARALSVYLLVFFGGMSAGSMIWGGLANIIGAQQSLAASAAWMVLGAATYAFYRLPSGPPPEVEPSHHWPEAPIVPNAAHDHGPVLVTVEYHILQKSAALFRSAVLQLRSARLRDGAIRWDLFQDAENHERFVEAFLVESWAEHLRQHERVTHDDRALERAARAFHVGDQPPKVTHLVAATGPFDNHHAESRPCP